MLNLGAPSPLEHVNFGGVHTNIASFLDLVGVLRSVFYENSLQQVWNDCDELAVDWMTV